MSKKELSITLTALHKSQSKVIEEKERFNVLCCGRRWGKSALAVNLLSETILEGMPCGYFTPTYKLLDGTYKECVNTLEPIIKRKHEHQFIELITGGSIEFWSLENDLAGRSRKYKRIIIDEGAFAKNLWKLWTESIRATLTDYKGDAWFMSTPRGKNDFFRLFMQRGRDNWVSWQMPTETNPYIDKLEIEDARIDLPELAFAQEYLAQFNDNVANPFGVNWVERCTKELSNKPSKCYGIDLAKSVDYTVIIGLDEDGNVSHFQRFQKDWKQTIDTIIRLPKDKMVAIDSTGVGDPIAEELQRHFYTMESVKFTSTSKQQMMEALATAIQQVKIGFPKGLITDELEQFEYQFTKTGVRYSAPSGMHDDCVMALALAWKVYVPSLSYGQVSVW
jgi:phage FluMu gp28-like protein